MIKTVIFDMGSVIITLDENEAGKRFIGWGILRRSLRRRWTLINRLA